MANYFKDNLKYIREQKGLSKNKLGEMTGVNQTTIGRWENGEISPTIDNVIDLMNALNLPINELGMFLGKDLEKYNTNNQQIEKYALLFDKVKDLPEDKQKIIINVTESVMKEIDEQLDGKP